MRFVSKGCLLGAILIVGSMLAGCSETSPGDPRPTNASTSTKETNRPTSSQKPTADRPREIKLKGTDPCSLIPQSELANFKIEKPGKREENPASKEPLCGYNGNLAAFNLTLNSKEGIEAWDESKRDVTVAETERIGGFPAIEVTQADLTGSCAVVVDVADGQTLQILAIAATRDAQSRKCEIAREFAESAMKTLAGGN